MKQTNLLFLAKLFRFIAAAAIIGVIAIAGYLYFVPLKEHYSAANICINNLRNIDSAKWFWFLKFHKSSNDIPTWDDLKPLLLHDKPYYKFDTNGVPVCPSGGSYLIGKIGEQPTCSLGTNVVPEHALK